MVSQGPILGLVVEYLSFLSILLTSNTDIASCADDTTPYVYEENLSSTIESLEETSNLLLSWFSDNYMKVSKDRCHVLLSTNENVFVSIGTAMAYYIFTAAHFAFSEKNSRPVFQYYLLLKTIKLAREMAANSCFLFPSGKLL